MFHEVCGMQGLAGMGLHPAYAHLGSEHCVEDASLLRRLGKVLSALAHWAPVLAESAFLPALAFPFVRLFKADLESCFEVGAHPDPLLQQSNKQHIDVWTQQFDVWLQHV